MKKFIILILLSIILPQIAFTQVIVPEDSKKVEPKHFFVDALVFQVKDSTKSRMDIYLQMPYEKLQFKKNTKTNNFDANIEYSIDIKDSLNESVIYKNFTETISLNDEQQKEIDEISSYKIKQFFLNPGNYTLFTILRDKNLLMEYKNETKVTVPDFSKGTIHISSIMFLSDYKVDSDGKKNITPVVSNNLGDVSSPYMFFEVYNNSDDTKPISINYKITDVNFKVIKEGNFSYMLQPGVNQEIQKLPQIDFFSGSYKFELYSNAYPEAYSTKNFEYRWSDVPISVKDLDLAIEQMIYIATSDELDYIRNAPSQAEKEKRFWKFWKDKDPTPSKKGNQTMMEYYRRVKVATDRFTTYNRTGWKSDMGMVYIIEGEPSEIERHPFEADARPYEIWMYYDLNQYFTFVDYVGFGEYTLITPIYDRRFRLH